MAIRRSVLPKDLRQPGLSRNAFSDIHGHDDYSRYQRRALRMVNKNKARAILRERFVKDSTAVTTEGSAALDYQSI